MWFWKELKVLDDDDDDDDDVGVVDSWVVLITAGWTIGLRDPMNGLSSVYPTNYNCTWPIFGSSLSIPLVPLSLVGFKM